MTYTYTNKQANIGNFVRLMRNKTLTMFEYTGLPDSLPALELEKLLQGSGYAVLTTEYEGKLTAFNAELSGQEKDIYNRPTQAVISQPLYNGTVDIDKNAVLIRNDDEQQGLMWLFEKYGAMINETDISIIVLNYNKRIQTLISANDDATVESASAYLDKVVNGELGVIGESKLFDSLKVSPTSTSQNNTTTDLVELQQYLKATLFNEIGMNAPYNMKRERLTDDEVQANTDNLHPLADNMLRNRQEGLDKVNELFDTNISVDFGSIWKTKDVDDTDPAADDTEVPDQDDTNSVVHDILDYLTSPNNKEPEDDQEQHEEEVTEDEDEGPDNDK